MTDRHRPERWQAATARGVTTSGRVREFGGAILRWDDGKAAPDYAVELSNDGQAWRSVRDVRGGNGGEDPIALPEQEAR